MLDVFAGCSPCACGISSACDPYFQVSDTFSIVFFLSAIVFSAVLLSVGLIQSKLFTKWSALSRSIAITGASSVVVSVALGLLSLLSNQVFGFDRAGMYLAPLLLSGVLVVVITAYVIYSYKKKRTTGKRAVRSVAGMVGLLMFFVLLNIAVYTGTGVRIDPGAEARRGAARCATEEAKASPIACEY